MVTKVKRRDRDGPWLNPKAHVIENGCLAATHSRKERMNVQRSSPDGRVEPEADAGRKMRLLLTNRMDT